MSIVTTKYVRKPLYVEAVKVTEENFAELAVWCQGTIVDTTEVNEGDPAAPTRYISVRVTSPMTPRQSQARVGDWILTSERGYKVYNARAFSRSFDEVAQATERINPDQSHLAFQDNTNVPVSSEAERVAVIKQEVAEGHLTHGEGEALHEAGVVVSIEQARANLLQQPAVGTGPMPEQPKPTDVEETHPPALPPNLDENVVYPTSDETTASDISSELTDPHNAEILRQRDESLQ